METIISEPSSTASSEHDADNRIENDRMRWDPFEGRVPDLIEPFVLLVQPWSPKARRVAWIAAAGVPVLLAGATIEAMEWGWLGSLLVPLGFVMVLGGGIYLSFITPAAPEDGTDKMPDRMRRAVRELAKRHGWSMRLVAPGEQGRIGLRPGMSAPSQADVAQSLPHFPGRPDRPLSARQHADLAEAARERDLADDSRHRRLVSVHDPAVHAAYEEIRPLLKPSLLAARPTLFHAVIHRDVAGTPVWTGLAMQGRDERNPRRESRRTVGTTTNRGGPTLVLVHALPLPDADGISATFRARREDALAPDPELMLGGRFDEAFAVKLREGAPASLSRALPPALRDALVGLHMSEDAEVMVHGGALFVRTITILPPDARGAERLEGEIEAVLERIGRALVGAVPANDRASSVMTE